MNISREEKKTEGLNRLHNLAEKFSLGPKLEKYFQEDRLYYSYAYSMDTIHYDERYAAAVAEFEKAYHVLVYHAVEADTSMGTMLSLLYVSDHKEEWEMEKLSGSIIMSYSFIVNNGWASGEFGDVGLAAPMGYLMRTR